MSMRGFLAELQKGLKSPVYLLYAADPFLLKEALFSVKRTIPETELDFLFSLFDAESLEMPMGHITDILYEVPFFGAGRRRVAAIDNCQRLSDEGLSAIGHYASKPSPDSVLLLLYQAERGRLKKSAKEALHAARPIPLDIREQEIPLWVKEKASSMGLVLTASAVDYLLGVMGPDVGLLSSEIEKLGHTGRQRLDKPDIEALVKGSGGYNAFDLTDALMAKDAGRVFEIYASLRDTVAPENLLGAINWKYTKTPPPDIRTLDRVFEILNETDIRLKSSGAYYPLEDMLFKLLRV